MNRNLFLLALGIVTVGLMACGDSENTEGFSESFRVSDTVENSQFSQTTGDAVDGDFYIQIVSTDVSSGFVELNEERLLNPNDFKNDSFDQTLGIELFEENTIEVEVRGKPGDQLCVRVYEVLDVPEPEEDERDIFERCVDREAGPPNNVEVVITPTPES